MIVTAGAGGCHVAEGETRLHLSAPRVDAVDTTGAGDAFVGALAAFLREGRSLEEAAAGAVRVASLSVAREGSMPSYPTRRESDERAAQG